jgi:hypothetical protein
MFNIPSFYCAAIILNVGPSYGNAGMFFIICHSPTKVIRNTRFSCLIKLMIIRKISFVLMAILDRESYANMLIILTSIMTSSMLKWFCPLVTFSLRLYNKLHQGQTLLNYFISSISAISSLYSVHFVPSGPRLLSVILQSTFQVK